MLNNTHICPFLSRMRFKTSISFLTGPNDTIIAGDNITQCEVIALDEVEVGSTWNIQNYIFCMLINAQLECRRYRRNASVHLYSRFCPNTFGPALPSARYKNNIINSNDAIRL